MGNPPHRLLADALTACGVEPKLVEVEWDSLCQEDVLTFSGSQFSDETLSSLADLYLRFPSRFVFASDGLQEAFESAVEKTPAMARLRGVFEQKQAAKLESMGLSSFEAFDPGRESLAAFAIRTEVACGFDAGELLLVEDGNAIAIKPTRPGVLRPDTLGAVLALLGKSAPDVPTLIIGTIAD